MHGTHNIFQVSFSKLRFRKTLLTPQKLLNFYYAKKLAVISFWPSMWADRMQNIAHQASSTEHNLFLQHFEDWFKKEYFFEILSSPWWSTTKYQMTANRSQEMKKEAAKEQRVRDQDMSIIDMKKSFRYLQIQKKIKLRIFLRIGPTWICSLYRFGELYVWFCDLFAFVPMNNQINCTNLFGPPFKVQSSFFHSHKFGKKMQLL